MKHRHTGAEVFAGNHSLIHTRGLVGEPEALNPRGSRAKSTQFIGISQEVWIKRARQITG